MRRKSDPYLQVKVNIPFDVNAKLEEALWDPLLKKPRYGGRSELITALIREWLAKQQDLKGNT